MSKTIVLDGGMGQELLARTKIEPTNLWSAKFTLESPEVVQEVHGDFLSAGAEVITLNSYTATPSRFARDSDVNLLPQIFKNAIAAAEKARAPYPNAKIAGCLPPLVASYVSPNVPVLEDCVAEYRQIVAWQSSLDLFLIETMTNLIEAEAALIAAKESNKPVWIAFSMSDTIPGEVRQGDSLENAISLASRYEADAVLLNCSSPEAIDNNLTTLTTFNGPVGAYANGFTDVEALKPGGTVAQLKKRENLDPETYLNHIKKWSAAGLTLLGGCCEIGPAHIQVIRNWVDAEKP